MTKNFDQLYKKIIQEATDDSDLPEFGQDQNSQQQAASEGDPTQTDQSADMGLGDELAGLDKPVSPEELELARLAVRALNFNIHSKDVNQYKMKVNGQDIPFERISDYFEQTKNWKPVLKFVEWVMNKYEGSNSKWSEDKALLGKDIISKIRDFNKDRSNPDMLLDNSKRLVWTRIILNAMLHADPSFNLVGTDVTEENMPDIFNMLKQNFNNNSRGLFNTELKGPSNN